MENKFAFNEYAKWREEKYDRAEDAAYAFGYYLIKHCRDEAIERGKNGKNGEEAVEAAVDTALHNVLDMLEGFFKLPVDSDKTIELELKINVMDEKRKTIESISISPSMLDLPIGYWKWAKERLFK